MEKFFPEVSFASVAMDLSIFVRGEMVFDPRMGVHLRRQVGMSFI